MDKGLVYTEDYRKQKSAYRSGVDCCFPKSWEAFLCALELVIPIKMRKGAIQRILECLNTARNVAMEVYPQGPEEPEVQKYVKQYLARTTTGAEVASFTDAFPGQLRNQ